MFFSEEYADTVWLKKNRNCRSSTLKSSFLKKIASLPDDLKMTLNAMGQRYPSLVALSLNGFCSTLSHFKDI